MTDEKQDHINSLNMRDLAGVLHIHSKYSDGTKSVPEIASDAAEAGLNFIILTDHNTLKPMFDGLEGFYHSVAVLIGYEINDAEDRNHYLALNLEKEVIHNNDPSEYVRAVKDAGGIGIIAHPDEKEHSWEKLDSYPWTRWDIKEFQMIEIWNQFSEWKENLTRLNAPYHVFHPRKRLNGPLSETLSRWDSLNMDQKIFAVGGSDAHALKYRFLKLFTITLYPYKVHFKSVRTHVMVPMEDYSSYQQLKENIYKALKSGRCFISNFRAGIAYGFVFYARTNDNFFLMGSDVKISSSPELSAEAPLKGNIRLIKDGNCIQTVTGSQLHHSVRDTGVYRVEIFRNGSPWIFSNPIWITG